MEKINLRYHTLYILNILYHCTNPARS